MLWIGAKSFLHIGAQVQKDLIVNNFFVNKKKYRCWKKRIEIELVRNAKHTKMVLAILFYLALSGSRPR